MPPDAADLDALRAPLAALPDPLPAPVAAGPFGAVVQPPGSKSIACRALPLAALAVGASTVRNVPADAGDVAALLGALRAILGDDAVRVEEHGVCRINGCGGRWPRGGELDLRGSGASTRFLAALGTLVPAGEAVTLDGEPRMRQRPIRELVEALRTIGVAVSCVGGDGFLPLRVQGAADLEQLGGAISFGRTASSQYVTAVLLLGAFLPGGVRVCFDAPLTSEPYVRMTLGVLRAVGAMVEDAMPASVRVGPQETGAMPGFDYAIEADASGAGPLWSAAAVVPGGRVTVRGIPEVSLQGDGAMTGFLEDMGATVQRTAQGVAVTGPSSLRPLNTDVSTVPDMAMNLAAVCAYADGVSELRGLRTLRVKECDRVEAIRAEFRKLGVAVEVFDYDGPQGADVGWRITPATEPRTEPVTVLTYNDHRMAMALAVAALRRPGVLVADPACVQKTYPAFWSDWAGMFGA